jgi:hypothetical protein
MWFNRRVILWSVGLYLALAILMSILHEMGHIAVCAADGHDYRIWVEARSGHMICFGTPEATFAYNAIGSVFGLAGTAAMVVVWRLVMPEQLGVLAVGLAYAID